MFTTSTKLLQKSIELNDRASRLALLKEREAMISKYARECARYFEAGFPSADEGARLLMMEKYLEHDRLASRYERDEKAARRLSGVLFHLGKIREMEEEAAEFQELVLGK